MTRGAPARPAAALLGLVLAVGAGGCVTFGPVSEDLEGSGRAGFVPSFRATWNIFPTLAEDLWLAGDLEYASGEGSSSQQIGPGQFLAFEGQQFNGPATISSEYALSSSTVAARIGKRFRGVYTVEGLLGLGVYVLDLTVASGGVAAHDRPSTVGGFVGVQLGASPTSWLTFYGRAGTTGGFSSYSRSLGTVELGATLRPYSNPRLALFGGWRYWDYDEERDGPSVADIYLTLSGPTAGIQLSF